MVGRSTPASKPEKERMSLIKREAWCIPCILNRTPNRNSTTIQHVVEGYRLGHEHSYGSCAWHHLGITDIPGWDRQDHLKYFGPSLAHGSREFKTVWAPERDLVKLQDYLIDLYLESGGWEAYNLPAHIGRGVRVRWQELLGLR